MKKVLTVIVLIAIFFQTTTVQAQDLLKDKDLTTIKVDNLSEVDIAKVKTQLESVNLSIEQAEPILLSKGMSIQELTKLKAKLKNTTISNTIAAGNLDLGRGQEKVSNRKEKDLENSLVFGSELFDNPTLNFEPNLKLATPVNYILGPGDELQISVYGVQVFNATIPVTVEGSIDIQFVGQIAVIGMTIEAATQKIRSAIANVYSTVRSGQSQVSVSLSKVRTIKITVIGSKLPGNYSVSSLATVYNALYLAGGPGKNGSYRNIELLRNNKVFKNVDIYHFLVNGDQSDNIGLKDNDVIRIPAYSLRVAVEGEVKRSGIFELKPKETFKDLLSFASGFNELAYTASINITQKTDKEFKVRDLKASEFATYKPQSGDVFKVTRILNRFENRIKITGAVFRPDTYSFYEGMRVSDLVKKAEGLKEDAYTQRARIIRLKDDLTAQMLQINLVKALVGDATANLVLHKEDVVNIYSILDFEQEYKITIDGEIKKPGTYKYHENLTLNDLLIEAGGLIGSSSKKVEIARMIKSEEIDDNSPVKAELFNLEIDVNNNEQAQNFDLKPFDVITIRRMAVYEEPEIVTIKGAVNYSGKYVLINKKEKIYDLIKRAGGLTSVANLDGVKINRPILNKQVEDLQRVNFNLGKNDSIQNVLTNKLLNLKFATIPVDWKKIVQDPNNNTNVTLFPGDEIEVAVYNENVKISGNVILTSEIPYEKGKAFGYYLGAVGGTDAKAWKKKAFIIYPNGKTAVSSSFFFVRSYPKVAPGSQIVVPERPEKKTRSTAEIISIGSIIATLGLLIITTFK
ncbi:SLBB domain-containing protein [Flavobacterium sp.]|uniref:SLBB domain-containing protein n=1 Tax=Flavobacterium sp. TaxID=239 RepID=UPI00286BFE23|nr:SLBB domain-containing protein [Flavobacterium sp.]